MQCLTYLMQILHKPETCTGEIESYIEVDRTKTDNEAEKAVRKHSTTQTSTTQPNRTQTSTTHTSTTQVRSD